MFLNTLNSEEKKMFIDMAIHVAESNGMIAEAEQHMIDVFSKEMELNNYDRNDLKTIDEIKKVFQNSDEASKRVAVFELMGLGYMDGEFDEIEDRLIKEFATAIDIPDETYTRLSRDIDEYITLIGFIQDHVFGQE